MYLLFNQATLMLRRLNRLINTLIFHFTLYYFLAGFSQIFIDVFRYLFSALQFLLIPLLLQLFLRNDPQALLYIVLQDFKIEINIGLREARVLLLDIFHGE